MQYSICFSAALVHANLDFPSCQPPWAPSNAFRVAIVASVWRASMARRFSKSMRSRDKARWWLRISSMASWNTKEKNGSRKTFKMQQMDQICACKFIIAKIVDTRWYITAICDKELGSIIIMIICAVIYLEPKWPLFSLEKTTFFWRPNKQPPKAAWRTFTGIPGIFFNIQNP